MGGVGVEAGGGGGVGGGGGGGGRGVKVSTYRTKNIKSRLFPSALPLHTYTHTFWRKCKCQSHKFTLTIDLIKLEKGTRVLWGVSHMTQHRLYLQCSLVNICLCSSFKTSRRFLRGAYSLGKRNDIRQGLAASHVNSHWLVNAIRGKWQNSCDARCLCKKQGMWEGSAGSHLNLQSHWTQDVFYLRKLFRKGFRNARFSWKKIRNPGAVGRVSREKT